MKRSLRHLRIITAAIASLVLVVAAALWVGAVEHWIGQELRALAAARLNPAFDFDDLTYTFPRTVTLRGSRLTSPAPEAPGESLDILAIDSLTMVLSHVPWPERPFHVQQLDLAGPTLRLVRIPAKKVSGRLLGFSDLLKERSGPAARRGHPPAGLGERFQARKISLQGGSVQFDPRDGSAVIALIEGITAQLLLHPSDTGAYGIDFSLDHHPSLVLSLRGQLQADDKRLQIDALSSTLQLAREHDHYLTPDMQKFLAKHDITGRLTLEATGLVALGDTASSHLQAHLELSAANYVAGDYALALDHVRSRISRAGRTVTVEEFAIDALGGHARLGGGFELDGSLTGALTFEGADLQIGNLLRAGRDPKGVPAFSGLLDFSGALRGPFAEINRRAQGEGRLSLQKARLALLPVLSKIDEAMDRMAEAAMKREHTGHDALSLDISFDGDRARIEKLRMSSRWYGLRGDGDVYFDSRLDLALAGGPL